MGKEIEYKLAVDDLQLLDCLLCDRLVMEKMLTPFSYIRMQTTYYDTEDGLIEKNRWMLRLRTENARSIITMKTPGEGHTRGEWEVETAYLDEALPKLAAAGAPAQIGTLTADLLLPICGAKFTRITAPLRLSETTSCMICGDVGELTGGGRKALLCELELELKDGSEEDLAAFVRTLTEKYRLSEQPRSKLERARALAAQNTADNGRNVHGQQ